MVTSDQSKTVSTIASGSADFYQSLNEDGSFRHPKLHQLSTWSKSSIKRGFDVLAVTLGLPLALPILAAVGLAVRLTSRGPVLFIQIRSGKDGKTFKIFKFRTIEHHRGVCRSSFTTVGNQDFTSIGLHLRKWKLDELPQIINVLRGEMSLVGPRPKVPEHERALLPCRPGLTGAATLAFAREEFLLDRIPKSELNAFVENVLLPLKRKIDSDYMSHATFLSDLNLILKSVFRQWHGSEEAPEIVNWSGSQFDQLQMATSYAGGPQAEFPAGNLPRFETPAEPASSFAATRIAANQIAAGDLLENEI